jgi:transcription elongation factor GreA
MTDVTHSISPEGRAAAEAELKHLVEVRRAEIVAAIKVAREFGDLSENAEYHAARDAQGLNEARIRTLEHHLAKAQVTDGGSSDGTAGIGSRVSYRDGATGKVTEVTLVHPLEASVADGKISTQSPIARSLLGSRGGDKVTLSTPRGEKPVEILEVG